VHALLELGDRDTHLDEIARAVFCVAAPVIVIVVSRPDEMSQVSIFQRNPANGSVRTPKR